MENNKIPTSEEHFSCMANFNNWLNSLTDIERDGIKYLTVEFAKMHVQAALKEASEKTKQETDEWGHFECIDKSSILNAYSLDNIK